MSIINNSKQVLNTLLVAFMICSVNISLAQNTGGNTGTTGNTGAGTFDPMGVLQQPGNPPATTNPDNTKLPSGDKTTSTEENGERKDGEGELTTNEEYEKEMETREARERTKAEYTIDGVQIFGAELFAGANRSTGAIINRPAPTDYELGPGDQIVLEVTGINVTSFNPTVQPDGSISLREFGRVYVGGRSMDAAREIVKGRLNTHNFSIDKGSTLEITITNIRSFNINVMGEVRRPGAKLVGTFNTVLDALNMAGGISNIGTFRYIQLIRNNKLFAEIDLYQMIINGDYSQNYYLKDDDLIQVRPYRTRVAMTGAVKRERWFEVKPEETLQDVLTEFAAGYTANAYTNIVKAMQYTDEEMRVRDIKWEDLKYFQPVNGDKYIVDVILNRIANRVSVQGAVFRPGNFELETTPTLLKLIEKAEGIKEEAFTTRAYLTRTNPETGAQENVTINLDGMINGTVPDILLQREDVLTIRSSFDLADQSNVTIAGKVRNAGTFNFYYGMTVEDVILLADGFSDGADYQIVQISRRVKDSDRRAKDAKMVEVFTIAVDPYLRMSDKSFQLEPYDVISIMPMTGYAKPIIVQIEGEVMYPGSYPMIKRDDRISDLIKRAGGTTQLAYAKGASFKRTERANTSNEAALDQYRKELRTIENKANIAQGVQEGEIIIKETSAQMDPHFVTINLENILKRPDSEQDLILKGGDVLSIPKLQQTVEIRGQVGFPTIAVYEEGKEVLDYIKNDAGGFSELALRKNTTVEYLNGRSSTKRLFGGFPEIEPGAVIYVPAKTITVKEKFDYRSFVALGASLTSTAAMIIAVMRMNN